MFASDKLNTNVVKRFSLGTIILHGLFNGCEGVKATLVY